MKLSPLFCGVLVCSLSAVLLRADVLPLPDPDMSVDTGGCCTQQIENGQFDFFVNGNGGGIFVGKNTGANWTNLLLLLQFRDGIFNISSDAFAMIQVSVEPSSQGPLLRVFFSGVGNFEANNNHSFRIFDGQVCEIGSEGCGFEEEEIESEPDDPFFPGILTGTEFTINLNNGGLRDPNGTGGWVANSKVIGLANVPEPSTGLLMLTVAGAALGLRKLHLRA